MTVRFCDSPAGPEAEDVDALDGFEIVDRIKRVSDGLARRWRDQVSLSTTMAQFRVLQAVAASPGCTQITASRTSKVDRSTVGAVVARLIERGYLHLEQSPSDRRNHRLSLTQAGQIEHDKLALAYHATTSTLIACLSDQERQALAHALRKLADHADPRPCPPGEDNDSLRTRRRTP